MRYVILLALLLSGCSAGLYDRPNLKGKCGTYKLQGGDTQVICF